MPNLKYLLKLIMGGKYESAAFLAVFSLAITLNNANKNANK
jgi:hypothetical protein